MDNGDKPPDKKYFDDPVFINTDRTFKGNIDWRATPFNGSKYWVYVIEFSEDYKIIKGGCVNTTSVEGK